MITKMMLAALGAGLALAPAAHAQTAPPPAPPAASVPADAFSAEDIQKFARADTKVSAIQADANVADGDKQAKMVEAVQAEGLTPQRFNAIAQAAQTNPELQQKIQQAAPAPATE